MKIREKNKNKYGVSLMISYVLLIFITISLSIGVYIWLKDYATISEKINCKEGTSLTIENYNIEHKNDGNNTLNLTIKNNGLFNVSGFLISAGNDSKKIPMQLLWHIYQPQPYPGYFDFEPELSPGQKTNAEFNLNITLDKLEIIQMQPYIFKKNNIDKIFCEQALIKQVILINPSLIPGLVSWWKFDGNVLDYGDGNNGINNGTVFVNGRLNQGGGFDGVNDYVYVSDTPTLDQFLSSDFSISVWFNSIKSGVNQRIVSKADYITPNWVESSYLLGLGSTGFLSFSVFNISVNPKSISTTSPVSINIWHHGIAVYNGSNLLLYLDGKLNNSVAYDQGVNDGISEFNIGARCNAGSCSSHTQYFNGTIDEVAIYNKALSAWEVLQLYNSYNITS